MELRSNGITANRRRKQSRIMQTNWGKELRDVASIREKLEVKVFAQSFVSSLL